MRTYGQDIKHSKSITLYVGSTEILIRDVDHEVNGPRSAHYIKDVDVTVFVNVVKRGNSTVSCLLLTTSPSPLAPRSNSCVS